MSRPFVFLAVAVGAVVLAYVAVMVLLKTSDPVAQQEWGQADVNKSGRTPAFHLFIDGEARTRIARECLNQLTSAQAEAMGVVKDDLALLADDPAVMGMILEDYEQRVRFSRFEAAGFADIFERIRDPRFVRPTALLFSHEEFQVRHKAAAAARTQADPSLTPLLDGLLQELERDFAGKGIKTEEMILHAAWLCGGDHLAVITARGLESSSAEVRDAAALVAREADQRGLIPRLKPLLRDEQSRVRLQAAHTLAAFGQEEGERVLLAELNPLAKAETLFIVEALRQLEADFAIPALRGLLEDLDGDLRPTVRLTLAALGDAAMLEEMRIAARGEGSSADAYLEGLVALAARGEAADIPVLMRALREGGQREVSNVSRGLEYAQGIPDLELATAILRHPGVMNNVGFEQWLPRLGDAVVPVLAEELDASNDVNRTTILISCLGLTKTSAGRAALLKRHVRHPGLVEQQVRLLDLDARQRGLDS